MGDDTFESVKRGGFDKLRPCFTKQPRGDPFPMTLTGSPIYHKIMEGQQTTFNKESKVLILELHEVFARAGIIFNWKKEFEHEAFGINKTIIQFVLGTESKLLIHYHSGITKKEYWINYDTIRKFLRHNNNEFRVSETKLIHNIPLALFKPKPTFSGDQ